MTTVSRTFSVIPPPSEVIAYLADFSHAEEWDPGTETCTRIDDGPIAVGATWHNTSKIVGITTELTYTLTELTDDTIVLVGKNDSATSTDTITVQADGSGSSVTYEADLQMHGAAKLATPAMKVIFEKLAGDTEKQMTDVLNARERRPVTNFGYTLMTEQSGPRELVRYAASAEGAGFDFEVSSDHYFPWLTSMGHSPYAWSVLGAVAQATERVELMTYVTCPTMRYHPAVVAQKAATLGLLSDNRFTLGLGSGENLNEHAVGAAWPSARVRQDMLIEAITIIRALHEGEQTSWSGEHFSIESAKIWDLPDQAVQIGVAVSGESSIEKFAPLVDHLIAVEPDAELVQQWTVARADAGLPTGRRIGQVPICWGPDKNAAVGTAHELFRWFGGGWHVNANLPTPAAFAAASQFVTQDDVADSIACGPDLDELAESVRPFIDADFTDVAIVQIGDSSQDDFLATVAGPLLERLRRL